jgi:hypothetical protein
MEQLAALDEFRIDSLPGSLGFLSGIVSGDRLDIVGTDLAVNANLGWSPAFAEGIHHLDQQVLGLAIEVGRVVFCRDAIGSVAVDAVFDR